jgi:Tfp pilus assembly protein PilO
MPRNSSGSGGQGRDPKLVWRSVLGLLLLANVAAVLFLLFPPGGSADEVEQQLTTLRTQVATGRLRLDQTRKHVAAVEKGRNEGDHFLDEYFLSRRTAYSTLLSELVSAASTSGIRPKEHAYTTEPVDGSDNLSQMSITANYEGSYANLMRFIHEMDRSPRLLIIEALNAAPQQGTGLLTISMKIDTFIREDGTPVESAQAVGVGSPASAAAASAGAASATATGAGAQ